MRPSVTIFGIVVVLLQTGCAKALSREPSSQGSTAIPPFSNVAAKLPIKFENLSTDYLGALYFSADLSTIALPIYLAVPIPSEKDPVYCKFKAVGKYQVTQISDREARFSLLNPQIYFDNPKNALLPDTNLQLCLGVDRKVILSRIMIGEYDKTASLKTDRVTLFNDKIVVFGSHDQQPFPWHSNVFVRVGEIVDNTENFFSWYNGTYSEAAGWIRIDPNQKQIRFNISPNKNVSPDIIRAGMISRSSLCHLQFTAPIERVTYDSEGTQGYAGMFLWLKRTSIPRAQQDCIMNRVSMANKFIFGDLIAMSIDIPGKNQIRMSFNDMYWLGTLK